MTVIDNFNSYSDGNLNGQGGWASGTMFQVQGTVVQEGAKAVKGDNSGAGTIVKSIVSYPDGILSIYMRPGSTNCLNYTFFKEGSLGAFYVSFMPSAGGSLVDFGNDIDGKSDTLLTGYSADTWYHIELEIDAVNNRGRARIDGGSWTPWRTTTAFTGINKIQFNHDSVYGDGYWDNITYTPPNPPVIYSQDFEALTNGALVGQDGWTEYTFGSRFSVGTTAPYSGTKSSQETTAGTEGTVHRDITPVTSGKISVICYMRKDTDGYASIGLGKDNTENAILQLNLDTSPAKFILWGIGSLDVITSVNSGEYYKCELEVDIDNDTARARINDGTWSSPLNITSLTQVNRVWMASAALGSTPAYHDEILVTNASTVDKTITTDGVIKITIDKTLDTDGIVKATAEETITTDGLVKTTVDAQLTTDGIVHAQVDKTFTTDGIVYEIYGPITVKINGIIRTSLIDWRSIRKQENLTSQVDIFEFSIKRYGTKDYKPEIMDEVELYDGDIKIFAGNVVETEEAIEASRLQTITCLCKDYTHVMDRRLVIETYQDTTIDDVIEDIKTKYLPAGFTTAHVNAPVVVKFIAFNYQQPSKCLQQLAELTGYDWYVDYDKDIHFFSQEEAVAPFGLTDNGGKYYFNSLVIKKQVENLRNTIYVRGGKFFGDPYTEKQTADGEQKTFFQAYRYQGVTVKKNSGTISMGVDNLDDPAGYDVLYNFQEKALKFRDDNKPTAGDVIEITGDPQLPVIIKRRDFGSISKWDVFEHKIVDKSLNSKDGAKDRAKAEIIDWGDLVHDSSFETKEFGLKVGQIINVQSDIRNLNENFIISRINSTMRTPTELVHRVNIMGSRSFGMNEFLQKLLVDKDREIQIDPNEILDKVESADELITLAELATTSTSHNPQSETGTLGEAATVRALDYPIEFVLGPYPVPTGYKREFALDGAVLS